MACINKGKPFSPKVKFKTIEKIKEQQYISDQAYLISENGGIAIYLSYELNKSLENIFNKYSISGYMGISQFIKMCNDYNVCPKNINNDTLCYIFKKAGETNIGFVEFKEFFHVLHKLSSFIFRKLIMTDQEKFNVLIKHLCTAEETLNPKIEKFNIGIQATKIHKVMGINAIVEKKEVGCEFIARKEDKGIMTDMIQQTEEIKVLKTSSKILTTKTTGLEMKEIIEEIENKSKDKDEQNKKLNEELNNALITIEEHLAEIEKLNKENKEEINNHNENINSLKDNIKDLEAEKANLEEKQKELNENFQKKQEEFKDIINTYEKLKKEYKDLKKLLILPPREEIELLNIFYSYSLYNAELAEYVINKRRCADFLATYYILKKNKKNNKLVNLKIEDTERLFKEAMEKMKNLINYKPKESLLNYFFYKLFLCKIGNFLYPDLRERESFLEIVLNHILFLEFNKDFNEGNELKKQKNKNTIREIVTKEFDVFTKKIKGNYTSSDDNKKYEKKKKSNDKNNINTRKRYTKNIKIYSSEESFEYIDSNEIKKIKEMREKQNKLIKLKERMKEKVNDTKIKYEKNKLKHLNNLLIKNKYNMNNYSTYLRDKHENSENSISDSNESLNKKKINNLNLISQKLKASKVLSLQNKNDIKNEKYNIENYNENELNIYNIEGTIWSPEKKREFYLPQFGN